MTNCSATGTRSPTGCSKFVTENNKRELELTRHVSLRQLDPLALLTLKATGSCAVTVPEWLYDRDCPGHYMRRIKSVALSIPSVVGPYTSVNCTLSLLKSSVRKSPVMKDGEYARQGSEDDRFVDYAGAVQSIVTSGANNDSGMFETNLRDERFLPFEGAGAVSEWKLDLPKPQDYPAFDYTTVSDVILHIRYTARQGVDPTKVKAALDGMFQQAGQSDLALLFSLRHDFPTEWSMFVNGQGEFSATIHRDHFPYFTHGKQITIVGIELYSQDVEKHHAAGDKDAATIDLDEQGQFTFTAGPDAPGPTQVLTRAAGAQVFLVVRYSL
jgi:Tc toxin complex TcA C-terminal TcB-binding domain